MTLNLQEQLYESSLKLHGLLSGLNGRAFGYFVGGKLELCNSLHIPGYPERANETRNALREMMEGMALVYLFALWEDHIDNDCLSTNIGATDLQKLRAFKHVRHTVSHGTSGKRARQCRNEFESEMPFAGILFDKAKDRISLASSSVAHECLNFMIYLAGLLASKLYCPGFRQSI
jgi:hypothetical protein